MKILNVYDIRKVYLVKKIECMIYKSPLTIFGRIRAHTFPKYIKIRKVDVKFIMSNVGRRMDYFRDLIVLWFRIIIITLLHFIIFLTRIV
jgi:hypothetical protein